MDSTWPFNFDNISLPRNLPSYYDLLIIPEVFYDAVIQRNIKKITNIIKYHPKLSIGIISFYNLVLKKSFLYRKNAKFNIPYKIKWNTKLENHKIILNFAEQYNLYDYIVQLPWKFTNMGFLINTINNYLVQLRFIMGLINNKIPVPSYYSLGVNVHNNIEMKNYIAHFIPGQRI